MESLLVNAPSGRYDLFIDGRFRPSASGQWLESINPASEDPWYTITESDATDVDAAVDAARNALVQPAWSRMTQTARGKLLRRLGDLIAGHAERLRDRKQRRSEDGLSAVLRSSVLRRDPGQAPAVALHRASN